VPKLSQLEQDEFLNETGILMHVSVVREDGGPLVTPIWFVYEEGAIYFTPREKSAWFACLRRDPRVALCIDEQNLPYRKIIVEGIVELVYDIGDDDAWRDQYQRIAQRYVGLEGANAYVTDTIDQPRGLFRVALQAAKVTSWRMPQVDEAGMGIWHNRYYVPGTKF